MSTLQFLRTSLAHATRSSVPTSSARSVAFLRRRPVPPATRRHYTSEKGKEKEDATKADVNADVKEFKPTPDQPASKAEADDLSAKLQVKQDEIVDLTGRLRYAQADFINLQRISAREKEQTKDFAISRFASDLLETADTLNMALRAAPQPSSTLDAPSETPPPYFQPSSPKPDALLQGVEATYRILLQTLAKYGIKPFDPTGDTFDPNKHEALYSVPVPGKKTGEVLECQKVGYMIKDRVLRAAQVGVAAEQPAEQPAETKKDT